MNLHIILFLLFNIIFFSYNLIEAFSRNTLMNETRMHVCLFKCKLIKVAHHNAVSTNIVTDGGI